MMLEVFLATTQEVGETVDVLPTRQRVVAVLVSILILLGVLELVRQRKLREEYSALWVVTALGLLVLALNYRILVWFTHLIGAVLPTSTLFFGGLVFLMLLALQFSVRLSRLTYRSRSITRRMALLEEELRELKRRFPEEEQDLKDDERP